MSRCITIIYATTPQRELRGAKKKNVCDLLPLDPADACTPFNRLHQMKPFSASGVSESTQPHPMVAIPGNNRLPNCMGMDGTQNDFRFRKAKVEETPANYIPADSSCFMDLEFGSELLK